MPRATTSDLLPIPSDIGVAARVILLGNGEGR